MDKKILRFLKRYLIITLVSLLYGVGVSLFLEPNHLIPGGLTGISMIISKFVPLQTGTIFALINIPILIAALFKFGWKFIISTMYAVFWVSFFTNLFEGMPAVTNEPLLAVFIGDMLIAFSIGMIFKQGATSGGADIIIKFLRLKHPYIKTGSLFMMFDFAVIGLAGFLFQNLDAAFYCVIGLLIMQTVMDYVLYGQDEAKLVYIISDKTIELSEILVNEIEVGVTFLKGKGAYSNKEKEVIMCVVKKNVYPKLENAVKDIDHNAFLIVTQANEIYGEGYKNIRASKL